METKTIDITDADPVELTYKLRYEMGWSYTEIAKFLRIPVGTVESRLARGRKRHGRAADWKPRSMKGSRVHH